MSVERGASFDESMAQFRAAEAATAACKDDQIKARADAVRTALRLRDLEYCFSQGIVTADDTDLAVARSQAREARQALVAASRCVQESQHRLAELRTVLSERWRALTEATAYPIKQEEDEASARRMDWVRSHAPGVVEELQQAWAQWEAVTDDYLTEAPASRKRVAVAEERLRRARETFNSAAASAPV